MALHFVKDEKTRFSLALECGNIDVALEAARVLDQNVCWQNLAQAALLQGYQQVVEMCYQRTKNFEKLAFLYLVTGNFDKLKKMTKIAEIRKDFSAQYQGSLLIGDIVEMSRVLKTAGQNFLANNCLAIHNIEQQNELNSNANNNSEEAVYLCPPIPVHKVANNWPLLTVTKSFFDGVSALGAKGQVNTALVMEDDGPTVDGWESEDEEGNIISKDANSNDVDSNNLGEGEAGWGDLDLQLPPELDQKNDMSARSGFVPPTRGTPMTKIWERDSKFVVDHVLAGSFNSAFDLLHKQIGVIKFDYYKQLFLNIYSCSRLSLPLLPNLDCIYNHPLRSTKENFPLPAIVVKLADLIHHLQMGYQLTTAGKFQDAIPKLQMILRSVPLLLVQTRKDESEARELINICRNYILGLKMETERKSLPKSTPVEQKRVCELAAYFTHCNLQPKHQILTLRAALNMFFKAKNYKTASAFGRRLVELGPDPEVAQQARKILQACANNLQDEFTINYDEHNPFTICAFSFTPIYRGKPEIKCPFCNACYHPKFKDVLCNVCEVAQIDKDCTGLRISTMKN